MSACCITTTISWDGRLRTFNFPVNSRAVCQLTYIPERPSVVKELVAGEGVEPSAFRL